MKFCKDCKYCVVLGEFEFPSCNHPKINEFMEPDMVTGVKSLASCSGERVLRTTCGEDANLFEPKATETEIP